MTNRCQKNTWFSTPFFLDFSWFWRPKTTPKSRFFRCFFENGDFVKIIVFLKENCYFSGFEPPKNDPKSMPKRTRKKHRKKTSQKSILASVLASQNFPESTQQRNKSKKIAFEKKSENQTPWTLGDSPDLKPFGTPPDHPTTFPMISTSLSITLSIYLSIYLSIDLPLVALIIKASCST